jgi:hypothetical protein
MRSVARLLCLPILAALAFTALMCVLGFVTLGEFVAGD